LDTGDILYQVRLRTRRDDSVDSLYDRIMDRSVRLVGRLISDAEANRLQHRPQGAEGASYFSSVSEEDFRLDWRRDAEQLRRWIRTTPGRCCCEVAGERIYLSEAELAGDVRAAPGTLVRIGRTRCTIAAGSGALNLGLIRTQDGDLPAAAWCRRSGLQAGEQLGEHSATDIVP
jgi:methionyl-tRNA formyltransferase